MSTYAEAKAAFEAYQAHVLVKLGEISDKFDPVLAFIETLKNAGKGATPAQLDELAGSFQAASDSVDAAASAIEGKEDAAVAPDAV